MSTSDTLEDVRAWLMNVQESVDHIRTNTTLNLLLLLVIIAVGTGIAWFHWVGYLLGGLAIGVISRSLIGALFNALWFGVVTLAVFALTIPREVVMGVPEMTPIAYVTIGSALGLPLLGALVQGIFLSTPKEQD